MKTIGRIIYVWAMMRKTKSKNFVNWWIDLIVWWQLYDVAYEFVESLKK